MLLLNRRAVRVTLLLALILIGGALRFTDINWDRFQHLHPDERFIVWVADTMRWPTGVEGGFVSQLGVALDPEHSALNPFRWPPAAGDMAGKPRSFAYGHFPLYLLVVAGQAAAAAGRWFGETTLAFPAWMQPLHTVGRQLGDYSHLSLVGRAISALADLGTLLLVYAMSVRVARRLIGHVSDSPGNSGPARGREAEASDIPRPLASQRFEGAATASLPYATGLLAAAAYTFAVLPIQLSHYAAVDALLTFFITATVALAARYAEQGGRWTWVAAGMMAGLAIGSKFSAVMLALPLFAAALYAPPHPPQRAPNAAWLLAYARHILGKLAAAGLVAVVTFAITNPFALLEFRAYVGQIVSQNAMVSGVMDPPYTRQYIGTIPYWYLVQQLSQWGLTWPLAIICWAGLVWGLVRFGLGRASAATAVLLAWGVPYFMVTGAFHTKFLRYMAPLLPFLLVFGAVFAVRVLRWLVARWGSRGRWVWAGVALGTALVAVLWSFAFTNVYRQEHPWIDASLWIYRNVPEGSKIISEEWDDALPLTMDEIAGRPPLRSYERSELTVWAPDSGDKVDKLATELASSDYLAVASNRAYAPIKRLGVRYPMTFQYYRQLFSGELGYELAAEFSAYPRLGSLVIRDDNADESFSVYDHPRPMIFQNVGRLSADEIAGRLQRHLPSEGYGRSRTGGPVLAEGGPWAVRWIASRQAEGKAPGLASLRAQGPGPSQPLTLAQPVESLPDVTDYRWNPFASGSTPVATLLWWFVISVFGWFAWPLLFPLARGLADRGHALSRMAGWLLLGWLHWMGASLDLWTNSLPPLVLLLLFVVLVGRVAWAGQRREMAAFWRTRKHLILGQEALFAGAYLLFVLVRLLNPDLWHPWNGGEKFMDFAFLNATLRSPVFPPYDPYFAGGTVNYYYFGLYLVGLPVRLTGIFAEVAYNLAVPSLFALAALGVFSVAYSLSAEPRQSARPGGSSAVSVAGGEVPAVGSSGPSPSPAGVGLLAVVVTLLLGNLTGLEWALNGLAAAMRGEGFPAFDYWAASRVIPFTINEFPLWTFTFADLHPHLISMPFGLLVIGLSLDLLRSRSLRPWQWLVKILVVALALGALGAINTWDLPTYALLVLGALLVAAWRATGSPGQRFRGLAVALLVAAALIVLAVLAYRPFYANYQPQVGDVGGNVVGRFLGWVRGASPMQPWLHVWGFFLFLSLSYVTAGLLSRRMVVEVRTGARDHGGRVWLLGVLLVIAVLAVLAALGRPTAALAALPLLLAVPLPLDRTAAPGRAFVGLLLILGLGVVAGTELVYLRDFLEGGDWYRMNTLFKFSVPAWILLGIAGGYMLARLWVLTLRAPAWLAVPWQVGAAILLAGGLVFLLAGVRARVEDRFPGAQPPVGTLDGLAYMTVAEYTWPDNSSHIELTGEYQALKWLLNNVRGAHVVAEAPAGSYTLDGEGVSYDYYRAGGLRVASITGLPTLVGHHQYEQRPAMQVAEQGARAMEFFRTTDLAVARRLMRELRVDYIYFGRLEHILFTADSLRKFEVLVESGELEVAFRNDDVIIYRVLI